MFDCQKPRKLVVLSGGEKAITVRFPTDAEWIERSRRVKTIRRVIGRGKSQSEAVNFDAANAELLAKIRLDEDGPDLSPAEATSAVGKLERCDVLACEREGGQFRIEMEVRGAPVVHVLRIPTQDQVQAFGRQSVRVIDERRSQEIRVSIEPSAELYDSVHVRHEGYIGDVPIIHKDAAVMELLAAIDQEAGDEDPEE